ncbi:hypothetical protein BDN71DRAFT_1064050 [Pleurotus eryngii]|uniref:Uncharacterized protein n=1 Tax=Pleurotus eryngii TaxID=5323 RepID=A0A9P5ZV19_PLEER|nr:hypothetical protein BDN71DRAFT_1064050 [Pleurotus eryngii]
MLSTMPSLWSEFWRMAVLLPLSFLLSTIFDVRRMEDSSYALWSALLLQLCDMRLDVFLICPQYALYVSPKAECGPNDSFSSTLTQADGQAKGVIIDNCLIIPEIRRTQPDVKGSNLVEYLSNFFNAQPSFSGVDVRIRNAIVPIIVEQKRPPSCHPQNIYDHHQQIHKLLGKAILQARDQGACLFSMPKFARQTRVMLIGASGAWWQFCLVSRPNTDDMVFDLDRYGEHHPAVFRGGSKAAAAGEEGKKQMEQGKGDNKNNKNNEDNDENNNDSDENSDNDDDSDDDEDEDGVVGTEDNKFDVPTSPNQARAVQMAYNEERSKKERMERRERRERIRDESWESSDAKKRLGQFMDSVGEGPYTMAQLDKCSELVLGARNSLPAPFCHRFDGDLQANDPRIAHWTKPMLLGSPISDKYMAFIRHFLQTWPKKSCRGCLGGGALFF